MSELNDNSVAIPVDGTAHGNSDTKATAISDEGYRSNFTPINSAADNESITPIKREAAEDHESEPRSKKRSGKKDDPKAAKGSTKAKKSTATAKGNTGGRKKSTPKKKPSLIETKNDNLDAMEASPLTVKGQSRKREAPKNAIAPPRPIPLTWDEADEADKMLVRMRDRGEEWGTIRPAWTEITGEDPSTSTLPNRYSRIKARMGHLQEGDSDRIFAAKAAVEAKFQADKLSMIADCVQQAGGQKYSTRFLQRHIKQAENAGKIPAVTKKNDDQEEEE